MNYNHQSIFSTVQTDSKQFLYKGSQEHTAMLCPWARHFTPRKYWLITQEAVAPSWHDWKIVDWDVKPQHKQTNSSKNHNKLISLSQAHIPSWSGSVPVQLICFYNSYILNTFLYDKNLAWALSFIFNKIYEIFNTMITKTFVPSLLIWSRAGPGSIIENKSPWHKQIMPCPTSLIGLK